METIEQLKQKLVQLNAGLNLKEALGQDTTYHKEKIASVMQQIAELTPQKDVYNEDEELDDDFDIMTLIVSGGKDAMSNFADMMKKKGYYK